MFYSVTKCSKGVVYVDNVYVISRTVVLRDMQKYMVHVDNVYVISRTVALRDMQIYILEWYIVENPFFDVPNTCAERRLATAKFDKST
jgi:hypothetical protein